MRNKNYLNKVLLLKKKRKQSMSINPIEIKEILLEINKKSIKGKDDLSEEELRSIFLETKILNLLGYEELGKDIRLEKTISGTGKRTDIECEDQFGNTIFVIEFKKPSDPVNLEEHFGQLWSSYVIPLKSKFGILFDGLEIVFYERRGINEHILLKGNIDQITETICQEFLKLIKPEYNILDYNEVENYFNINKDPVEKVELKDETSRKHFYRNFQLSVNSLFGNLIISVIKYFKSQIGSDTFLISSYEFWRKSYARKPDKTPLKWKDLLKDANLKENKEDLSIFMFCLETAYSLFTRIVLAKVCEDYQYPHVNITKTILSSLKLKVMKDKIPYVGWSISLLNLMDTMRNNLVESIFEEDIFYWWNTKFLEMQSWNIKKLFEMDSNQEMQSLCKAFAYLLLRVMKYNFSEIVGDPIGDLYQQYFDKETRKALGEFYTPVEVVDYIIANIGYKGPFIMEKRLIDLSCGSGTFLVKSLNNFLASAKTNEDPSDNFYWLKKIKDLCYNFRIVGLDIHPFACIMAQIQYMIILIPYYKKALEEEPDFLLKRIPVFRTDSLWDATKSKLDKERIDSFFLGEVGTDDVILKITLPIKMNGKFLEITVRMPKSEVVWNKTDLVGIEQYFCALQAVFDIAKDLTRNEKYTIDKEFLEKKFKEYLVGKDWTKLVNLLSRYADEILKTIEKLKYKFGDGRLVKTIEDIMLSGLLKSHKYLKYDYIVGNPPYVNIRKIDERQKEHYKEVYHTAKQSFDLYCLFMELGIKLLGEDGKLGYIISDQFLLSEYGQYLREIILKKKKATYCKIEQILDFRDSKVFGDVINYPCILILKKTLEQKEIASNKIIFVRIVKPKENLLLDIQKNLNKKKFISDEYDLFLYPQKELTSDIWCLMPESEKKIFTHLDSVKDMKFEEICENIFVGTQTSLDDVYLVFKQQEIDNANVMIKPKGKEQGKKKYPIEKEILKPILKGKDITKWFLNWSNHWLIFPYKEDNKSIPCDQDTLEKNFPNTWKYFLTFKDSLKNRENNKMRERDDWYAFIYPKNHEKFEQIKLISQLLSQNNRFALDEEGIFYFVAVGGDCISLKEKYKDVNSYKYILALLNSSTLNYYMKHISPVHDGGYYLYIKQYLSRLPFIDYMTQDPDIKSILPNVDKILAYYKLKKKIEDFPNSYFKGLIKIGKEFQQFQFTFRHGHSKLKPETFKSMEKEGYTLKYAGNEKTSLFETIEKAHYIKTILNEKKVKKDEKFKTLIPKQNSLVQTIMKEYKKDVNNLKSQDVYQYEKNIDALVYKLYQLNTKDKKVIETFNEKY